MTQPTHSTVRNRLLRALPPEDFELLSPHLTLVPLSHKQQLYTRDEPIEHVHFPGSGIASLLTPFKGGRAIEVGMIGREGMIEVPVILGVDAAATECIIQIPGSAWRIEATALREAMGRSPSLRGLLLRYVMALLGQVFQTAACNRRHGIEERLARWLLMTLDRSESDALPLTQEFLASMLGVRRAGVTEAAGNLQKAGVIRYANGHVTILNRLALETASCECYLIVKAQFHRMLPPDY